MKKLGVVSADSHILEPPDLWRKYIEPAFRHRAPKIVSGPAGDKFIVDGLDPISISLVTAANTKPEETKADIRQSERIAGGFDPKARVKDMDLDGIDAEVLYPSLFALYTLTDVPYQAACFRAYNDWIADFCAAVPGRLAGSARTGLEDVDVAVRELRRVAKKGLKTIAITHAPPPDQPYSHPRYEPLWAAAEETGIPISLHAVTSARKKGFGPGEFLVFYSTAPVDIQTSLAHIIVSGVLERHPKLKLVSVENDIGWVGTWLGRLDHAFERHRFWSASGTKLPMKPSEYFHRSIYLTFQADKPGVENRKFVGVDNIMWASDYPHSDTTWPRSREFIQWQFGDLPEEERYKIVCGNAARLYNLE